jgi:hypothetical protein
VTSSSYTLYLDETGDHGLLTVNPEYPVLALCGVAVQDGDYAADVVPKIDAFKVAQLGSASIQLHYRAMARRAGVFKLLTDPERAWEFEKSLAELLDELPMTVFCAAIDKNAYVARHGRTRPIDRFLPGGNIYLVALDFVLERFVRFLEERGAARGQIIAEARGARENAEVAAEFDELLTRGTQFVSTERFGRVLAPDIRFTEKRERVAGLEIADICAAPIATQVLKPGIPSVLWEAIRSKVWISERAAKGNVGLKVYPRSPKFDGLFRNLVKQKSPGNP